MAALALHAARGVPTEASIRAQAETLPLIIGSKDGTNNQLPEVISWLADKAPKLISIRQSPMAGAQKKLRVLYDQLQARDYRAAAATTRLLILANDEAVSMQSEAALALQALYADLRAFSETSAARTGFAPRLYGRSTPMMRFWLSPAIILAGLASIASVLANLQGDVALKWAAIQ